MAENFPKLMIVTKLQVQGKLKKHHAGKIPEILYLSSSYSNLINQRQRVKLDRSPKRRKLHYLQRKRDKNCIGLLF